MSSNEPEITASGDAFSIPQNVILQGIAKYTQEQQDTLLWLSGYVRERMGNSKREACQALDCDWTTILRVLTGKYSAGIGNFIASVKHLRAKAEQGRDSTLFVETLVTRKIFAVLDLAKTANTLVHICGPSGRSKTHACREWVRRNNHGRAIYVDCPVLGGVRALMEEIAHRAGVSIRRRGNDFLDRVEKSFDHRHTIVIDEAVRLIPRGDRGSLRQLQQLEWLRRLHDTRGVGLAFVSTDIFRQEMETGTISSYLEQLLGRIEDPLYLPAKVSLAEAGDICRAFNEDADPALIRLAAKIANGRGRVRVLFTLIRQAAALAKAKKTPLAVDHLQTAVALRENLHRWPEE